jgi:hypothetical protein
VVETAAFVRCPDVSVYDSFFNEFDEGPLKGVAQMLRGGQLQARAELNAITKTDLHGMPQQEVQHTAAPLTDHHHIHGMEVRQQRLIPSRHLAVECHE